tara:strand:- start:141 stop:1136 length:996 start_codon:yes stop_codon:yes gene_type:complete
MASTYTTVFGIEEMASGDQSGAWGTTTNYNLDIVDRIGSFKEVTISGTSHTLTVREASPGSGTSNVQDGMYRAIRFKDGGDIGGNCTLTVAPNTAATYFLMENALSASRSIIVTQGSGANVTILNGKNVIIYCDGAGSGAIVYNGLADLQIDTVGVSGLTDGGVLLGGGSTGVVKSMSALGDGEMIVGDGTTDPVAESGATLRTSIGVAIGSDVQAYNADTLFADVADNLTAGYSTTVHDAGTKSSGTYTPDQDDGNIQKAVNGGAHTLAPTVDDCAVIIQYTNNASAGTITTSGFTKVDGDDISTTNGDDFFFYLTKANGFSLLTVKALQ